MPPSESSKKILCNLSPRVIRQKDEPFVTPVCSPAYPTRQPRMFLLHVETVQRGDFGLLFSECVVEEQNMTVIKMSRCSRLSPANRALFIPL